MDQLPAGWYTDQSAAGVERYWDGSQWTDQTRPVSPSVETTTSPTSVPPTMPTSIPQSMPTSIPQSMPTSVPQSMPTVVPTSPSMAAQFDYMDGMRAPKIPGIVIAAFVLSLAGIFTCGITGLIGLVLGAVGIGAAKRAHRGFGLALTAIIIGGICALFWLLAGISMVTNQSADSPSPVGVTSSFADQTPGSTDFSAPNP